MHIIRTAIVAPVAQQEARLTVWDIITDIPHDGPAIFMYVMLLAAAIGLWQLHKRSQSGGGSE